MKKIKVLVITYLPWREDNNIGNSYSNIFANTQDKYEFAHIYIRNGMPQNTLAKDYYHISIIKMMKRMFKPNLVVGERMKIEDSSQTEKTQFSSFFKKMKMLRWPVFFLVEELAGLSKSWKTKEFDQFIDDFDPDLIFGTLPDNPLISNLMLYVKNRKNIPLVTYPWDDYYSLYHSNLSPIFWIRKMMQRHYLYKTAQASEFLYVISNLMKDEYELAFKKDCRLMFKGYNFDASKTLEKKKVEYTIQLVYMGNIGAGRWKTLALLASAIRDINVDGPKMMLSIYTLSPTDDKMKAALNIDGTSRLNLPVPNEKKQKVMDGADILLHVEPFKKSEYQFYRASFSTKLVDYFYSAKCILAVGGMTASTDYLVRNDAAICITDKSKINESLMKIVDKPQLINEYAKKSWDCGLINHQIDKIQTRMYNDFKSLLPK
jgi:hypothetical protein